MPNIGDSLGQMLQQRALADAMKGKEGGQGVERPSAPSAAQGGGTPPAPAKPATTAPPTTSTPPTSTAPVPPEAGGKPQGKEGPPAEQGTQPARTAGPDGMVEYAFPGGRGTQRVPIPVADALDKAFANKAGTDARAAYQGTPASWTDDKQIGSRTDPAELRTGAVVVGERGAALLAVFGAEGGGTLEAIIDGELTPFTEEVQQQSQQLGPFVGFFLPNGIDFESADVELTPGLVGPASVVA